MFGPWDLIGKLVAAAVVKSCRAGEDGGVAIVNFLAKLYSFSVFIFFTGARPHLLCNYTMFLDEHMQ